MKIRFFHIFFILGLYFFSSCISENKNENNLTEADINFISQLGILEDREKIEMFESNGGFDELRKSGNFITNKRIASYWIDGKKDEINTAKYMEIDSIKPVDLTKSPGYSSFLKIYYSNGKMFEVYIDADSLRTWSFFNHGVAKWKASKK